MNIDFINLTTENFANGHGRIKEVDFLKGVFIILMVIFHLVYVAESYPYIKRIVYTFHMPVFLIISGYLTNLLKKTGVFSIYVLWLFVPYAIMETGYVIMSSVLPVREKVETISFSLLIEKVFLFPLGPYWYLHSLIIFSIMYYLSFKFLDRLGRSSCLIILGISLFSLAHTLHIISFSNALYYLIGVALFQSGLKFSFLFQPSLPAVVPFVILCCFPENLDRGTLAGVAITYLAISIALYFHSILPCEINQVLYFIGQNTLIILLFSPIFTILSRMFYPLFVFDPSQILFMCTAVVFTIIGCVVTAYLLDKANFSRILFGKRQILSRPYDQSFMKQN